MVKLSTKDSSILTRITRYKTIPIEKRQALLQEASPEAKEIGEIILGTSTGENAAEEIRKAADAYRRWLEQNRRLGREWRIRRRAARMG